MSTDNFLDYRLPQESAEFYARQALRVLKQLKTDFPVQYKIFRAPSEVLTLSGVRSFDTYYELGKDCEPEVKDSLKQLLQKHGVLYLEETNPAIGEDNHENRYSLLNLKALTDLPKQYRNLPGWTPFDASKLRTEADFFLWWLLWDRAIANAADRDGSPAQLKNWLKSDWFAPNNLTFGALLGYPGEAICSLLDGGADINADIKYAAAFDGAHPVYSFSKQLADNSNIVAHQQLWSDILSLVYDALGETKADD